MTEALTWREFYGEDFGREAVFGESFVQNHVFGDGFAQLVKALSGFGDASKSAPAVLRRK